MIKKSKFIFFLISIVTMISCDNEFFEYYDEYFEFDLPKVEIPIIITHGISDINSNSALGIGEVTFDGDYNVTSRGFYYATTTNPTASDNVIYSETTGTGYFYEWMVDLQPNTIYYVRAFATNSNGTGYGNQVNFTTNP